ncbi:MAG: lysylphosphatidylglycerol synthase transmembrane domain-containing protein [Candidatus Peribacteraceae bacterium]|nr:lysylphosphatidylglycerol synthase transmembrane domain-containing protein [Candidatus Peribacteraceae bacterium]
MRFLRLHTARGMAGLLLKGVGVLLFAYIIYTIDIRHALAVLLRVPPSAIMLTMGLFPAIYLLKAWRWHVLVRGTGKHEPFASSFGLYMSSLFLGIATPGKMGEALKIPALVREGMSLRNAILLTILDRVLDVLVLAVLLVAAGMLLLSDVHAALLAGALAAAILLLLIAAVLFSRLRRFLTPDLPLRTWLLSMTITVAGWCVYFLQLVVLAWGFGFQLPLPLFLAIMTVAGIVSVLPIAPAGLGTRDAALLFFFGRLGIPAEQTIAFAFAIFILTVLASSLCGYYWLRHPLISRR